MRDQFERERANALVRPKITDKRGQSIFESALATLVDSPSALKSYQDADAKRLGSQLEQHEAGYTYLALAVRLVEDPSISVRFGDEAILAARMFHYAGHAFREVGQLNRAADAYWRSGVISKQSREPDTFAIRSLARAKSCYADIGETDLADHMHFLEWEARSMAAGLVAATLLGIWRVTSRYGTSVKAWLVSLLVFLGVFTVGYETLHATGRIAAQQPWTFLLTAAYYCLVTTATGGYGDFVPNHWTSQLVVGLNIASAYVLLTIGATVLGRRVLAR